jgi:hypothetical protein
LIAGLVLFIVAAVLAFIGIQKVQEAIAGTSRYIWDAKLAAVGNTLGMGNFLIGVSVGVIAATVVWSVILVVTWRTRSSHD